VGRLRYRGKVCRFFRWPRYSSQASLETPKIEAIHFSHIKNPRRMQVFPLAHRKNYLFVIRTQLFAVVFELLRKSSSSSVVSQKIPYTTTDLIDDLLEVRAFVKEFSQTLHSHDQRARRAVCAL